MDTIKTTIQDALDEVASPRSSDERREHGLAELERVLAHTCLAQDTVEAEDFLALQYTFECNVPSRLLGWIATSTWRLESLAARPSDDISEMAGLTWHLSWALTLIQGIALNHPSTKVFLGRQYGLEILLDLLLASRHAPPPAAASEPAPTKSASLPLTSIVIDTLLCVLVDASPALRVFEEISGLQAIVKILKRAGTPREVRMKCLEFLYFYLLDEKPGHSEASVLPDISSDALPPTAPATPAREMGGTSIFPSRAYPTSSYGSSTFSFPDSSKSGGTSRSVSSSSASSFSSTSSNASSSTAASTVPSLSSSPDKLSLANSNGKPTSPPDNPFAPRMPSQAGNNAKYRSLMMLRKDVDFVPLSPKKAAVAELGVRAPLGLNLNLRASASPGTGLRTSTPRHVRAKSSISRTQSRLAAEFSSDCDDRDGDRSSPQKRMVEPEIPTTRRDASVRSIVEKKQLLGTVLGNVDALVEGVRKAGVWGLG
ncbi:hypothetical protein HGRIS_010108 [Hohenbuehelia grisea]|uniref:Cell division control protein 14 n=1 Tax=Hohenbuehelia grisea TaxID=104357 RepID=A0ABR3J3A1_9AGAR